MEFWTRKLEKKGGIDMVFDFDRTINRRGTHCFKWDSQPMNDDPELLPLFVADMDFQTAPCIQQALAKTVEHGVYGYTSDWDGYKDAVISWMKNRHGWDIEKEWILPFPGIVPAIKAAVRTFTKPGDEILIFKPVYYPFDASIRDNDRTIVEFALDEQDGFYSIDFEKLEDLLKKSDIKMVVFCNPHNPIGRVWTKEELKKLGDLCLKYNILFFSDEIHMDFEYGDHKFVAMLDACPELKEQFISATAPSKSFNLAGLIVSNLIIPSECTYKQLKKEMDNSGIMAPNLFGLVAAEVAYKDGAEWLDALLAYIEGNFDFMKSWFEENMPEVKMRKPEGLYLAWADFRGLGLSDEELEDFMLHEAHLWLDEGYIFGTDGSGWERFNCACPRSIIETSLNRIKDAWQKRQEAQR